MKWSFAMMNGIAWLAASIQCPAAEEGMTRMPLMKSKKTYLIPSREAGEGLQLQRGFGEKEPMVRMMNLMMVEGPGDKGMNMSGANAAGGSESEGKSANFEIQARLLAPPPIVGTNQLEFKVDSKNDHKPATGLKIKVQVSMTSMNMGTEEPPVRETLPGVYGVSVVFAMKGPWAVKVFLPDGSAKMLRFDGVGG